MHLNRTATYPIIQFIYIKNIQCPQIYPITEYALHYPRPIYPIGHANTVLVTGNYAISSVYSNRRNMIHCIYSCCAVSSEFPTPVLEDEIPKIFHRDFVLLMSGN